MIYLHKLLPLLLSPIVIILSWGMFGLYKNQRAYVIVGLSILYLASTPIISDRLFLQIERPNPPQDLATLTKADAIVVLGGMLSAATTSHGIVTEWSDLDRFLGGIRLYNAGKATRLIFTNGLFPWQTHDSPEGELLKELAQIQGIPAHDIMVTESVQNTEQESLAVKKLLGQGKSSILLVTSAFHMVRARLVFEKAGFNVQPYPVDYKVSSNKLTPMDFLPNSRTLDQTSLAIRELLGRGYYLIKLNGLSAAFQSP